MMVSKLKENKLLIYIFIVTTSALFLLISSTSSPLYPMNPWVDVNAYFTVGRGMLHGKVPYVDLFDVKGPLVFYLYSVMALISDNTFFGVFAIEFILFSLFLCSAYKITTLYISNIEVRMFVTAYVAFATVSSYAFEKGTSVEEICLWAMTYALYLVLRSAKTEKSLTTVEAMIIGLLGAWCFWIKYTMFGLFIGLAFYVIIKYFFSDKEHFIKLLLSFLFGFFVLSAAIIIALACQGALSEAVNSYFFANVSQYSETSNNSKVLSVIISVVKGTISFTARNLQISIVVWMGLVLAIFDKKTSAKLVLSIAFASLLFFDYGGGVRNRYYALVFAVFLPACLGEIIRWMNKKGLLGEDLINSKIIVVIFTAILITLTYFISDNTRLLRYSKADMPQFQFAEIINQTPNATILNYGYLDTGLYFATGIDPSNKYFYIPNKVMEDAAHNEQNQILLNGKVDYIVSVNPLDEKYTNYELVEQDYFDFDGLTYYLYFKR
ncbi:Dolichyl-phosphate-mannose-protein mannosyltransferase [Butyrivibrio hungatei DSM 14810]|uniref:Dolichyl-phosphate-mannose-protein mannosyltransferase n=1 Tax=Butyrivibrio hungatei DSM 14810 TaxID=1121132 RepID=A0A1M7T547_9FIRM|nr:glycosyltransferase family 39 protein [Butyrivibrio hungatei]SHN65811.1 Dolichyl-phosphate-mannose-protein mannosyltransferase [Butyrivibrio hungatei DSM 14810]